MASLPKTANGDRFVGELAKRALHFAKHFITRRNIVGLLEIVCLAIGQPDLFILVFIGKGFHGQGQTDALICQHQWGAHFGIAKNQHLCWPQFHADLFGSSRVINTGKDRNAF